MKENIRRKLLAVIGIILAIALQIIFNTYGKDDNPICEVFADVGTISSCGNINIYAACKTGYMTNEDFERLLEYIAGRADFLREDFIIEKVEKGYKLTGNKNNLKLISSVTTDVDKYYLKIDLEHKGVVGNKLLDIRREYINLCEKQNMEIITNSLVLKGEYPGCLTNTFLEENTRKIYKKMSVYDYSTHMEEGMYITYGFSPRIQESIIVDKERVNINVVYTYDEERNVTNIYMACPLINTDY